MNSISYDFEVAKEKAIKYIGISKKTQFEVKRKLSMLNFNEDIIQAEDFFTIMQEDLQEFDEKAWSKGEGYKTPRFPMIAEKLEGVDSGLYLLPAESNAGKSAMMMNIVEDLVMCEENKLFALNFWI